MAIHSFIIIDFLRENHLFFSLEGKETKVRDAEKSS